MESEEEDQRKYTKSWYVSECEVSEWMFEGLRYGQIDGRMAAGGIWIDHGVKLYKERKWNAVSSGDGGGDGRSVCDRKLTQ